MSKNFLFPNKSLIHNDARRRQLNQSPLLIWFTGLSGAGKSTIAKGLELALHNLGYKTYLLDADNIRSGLNKNIGFTKDERTENLRRVAEVSKLFLDAGLVILATFISPFRDDRSTVKEIVGDENYFEIYVDCPIEVCEYRDVNGLYKLARAGKIANFTGIDSIYEVPKNADIIISSSLISVDVSISLILDKIIPRLKIE